MNLRFSALLTLLIGLMSSSAFALTIETAAHCYSADKRDHVEVVRFVGSGIQMTVYVNGSNDTWDGVKRKKRAGYMTYTSHLGELTIFRRTLNSEGALEAHFTPSPDADTTYNQANQIKLSCKEGTDVEEALKEN